MSSCVTPVAERDEVAYFILAAGCAGDEMMDIRLARGRHGATGDASVLVAGED
jgi:hypothetical protein